MAPYSECRKNMVECQLETSGITSERLLQAFLRIPREDYLPENLKCRAYVDEDIPLPDGRYMMEPLVLGRMLQAADPRPNDVVLNIEDSCGYSSALLSELVTTIVALEPKAGCYDQARTKWAAYDLCNIAVIEGESKEGCPEYAPYSLIFVNGSVSEVPPELLDQLSIGGRLVTILKENDKLHGVITVIRRDGTDVFASNAIHDASTPYCGSFNEEKSFVF